MSQIGESLQFSTRVRRWSSREFCWLLLVGGGALLLGTRTEIAPLDAFLLAGAALLVAGGGLYWPALRIFCGGVGLLVGVALWRYEATLGEIPTSTTTTSLLVFWFSSHALFLWMEGLLLAAVLFYALALWTPLRRLVGLGVAGAWSAAALGMSGLLIRWRESYLLDAEAGHVPLSNLYEVFVLFCVITTLLYLYLEERHRLRALGAVLLSVVAAAALFLLWYTFARQADVIQPLVPALRSYWMKLHVPANFLGYGCFSLGAGLGVARLLPWRRGPDPLLLDELLYRVISLGFLSFTVATILGALWAAEAWGGYWSWDPKETWALIVWLNYAAWLHLRMQGRYRPQLMACWAVLGFFVTLFAFLGVNLYLAGLHSYGTL